METLGSDQTWGIITILVSAALGLTIALGLIFVINARQLTPPVKQMALALGFGGYLAWLLTLGDPRSDVALEVLYRRSLTREAPGPLPRQAAVVPASSASARQ